MPVTFTYDLEDSRASNASPERYTRMTARVLELLAGAEVRGTFFIVGEVAAEHPEMVGEIAAAGHEVALHGWRHVPLDGLEPGELAVDLARGKAVLEDAAQQSVVGFRAPIFSLVPSTTWALDLLVAAGFTYSSSTLPAPSPLYGYPGLPRRPFRWSNGLVELPCPVMGAERLALPFLGGIYLRYLPLGIVTAKARRIPHADVPWIYCHPYDFDVDEPFSVMPEAGWLTSRLLHWRRGGTFDRVSAVLQAGGSAPPLAERAAAVGFDSVVEAGATPC